jgi:hypothetical protein
MSAFNERLAIDIPGTLTDGSILALDFENVPELPRNFRSTKDPYKTKAEGPTTRYGLDGLNASAARQFSELDLKISLERMHS